MIIKVCGMRDSENISNLTELDIDMIGFIFYNSSERDANNQLDKEVIYKIPSTIKKIGVFVNESVDRMIKIAKTYQLQGFQLHGHESIEVCRSLKALDYYIMKVIHIQNGIPSLPIADYRMHIDAFVFDRQKGDQLGGTGESFDWSILDVLNVNKPFFVSGGISVDSITSIKQFKHPHFIGIDINSKFEMKPAVKDLVKIKKFIKEIRL